MARVPGTGGMRARRRPPARCAAIGIVLLAAAVGSVAREAAARIVVNEVMSNAPGADGGAGSPGDRLEFVELLNTGDADTVDLDGWTITDGDAIDAIRAWTGPPPGAGVTGATRLAPGGFALLLDPEYDASAEDAYPGIADDALILTVGNTTLGDGLSTQDPLTLARPDGSVASTFGTPDREDDFPFDPGDGVSWERIDPEGEDTPGNWMPCRDRSGATPGLRNSRSVPLNLSVDDSSLVAEPESPETGVPFELAGLVRNSGLGTVDGFEVELFLDLDDDTLVDVAEIQGRSTVAGPLEPGGSLAVSGTLTADAGGYVWAGMRVVHPGDGDPRDDVARREVRIGAPAPRVVLNEFYHRPPAGETEWVEIYNRTAAGVDLDGWSLSDGRTVGWIAGKGLLLEPGGYGVLCGDSSRLRAGRPDLAGRTVIEITPFPGLGNRSDTLTLRSPGGYRSDRVGYDGAWGGATGVSLERVNPDDYTPGRANWGSSIDPSGATPGRRNSISQETTAGKARIAVEPAVFSPDGDGDRDRAVIRYVLPVPRARVRLRVYDVPGRRVRLLLDQVESAGEGVAVWDGRDDGGRALPIGVYVVSLEAVDPFGGRLFREKASVVIGGRL